MPGCVSKCGKLIGLNSSLAFGSRQWNQHDFRSKARRSSNNDREQQHDEKTMFRGFCARPTSKDDKGSGLSGVAARGRPDELRYGPERPCFIWEEQAPCRTWVDVSKSRHCPRFSNRSSSRVAAATRLPLESSVSAKRVWKGSVFAASSRTSSLNEYELTKKNLSNHHINSTQSRGELVTQVQKRSSTP